jgi:hypothetical protein
LSYLNINSSILSSSLTCIFNKKLADSYVGSGVTRRINKVYQNGASDCVT